MHQYSVSLRVIETDTEIRIENAGPETKRYGNQVPLDSRGVYILNGNTYLVDILVGLHHSN